MIYTCHIGPIDTERQRCIYRQLEVYGDDWMLCGDNKGSRYCSFESPRIEMDKYRLELIKDGGGWLDSDVYPNEAWQPTEDGIWLCHSWERIDYWAIFNVNKNEYIKAMLEWYDKQEAKPGIGWPLRWFLQHREGVKLIPMGAFDHKYLTTAGK